MTIEFIKKAESRLSKPKLEKSDQGRYQDYVKEKRALTYKLTFLNGRGWPDETTLIRGGKIIFIEFKRKKKSKGVSANQHKVRRMLEAFGFPYYVCDDFESAREALLENL